MSITHSFYSELPSGQSILVEVEIEPPVQGRMYGEPGDCYPDEGGTAELQSVQLVTKDVNDKDVLTDIDTDDIWVQATRLDREPKFKYFNDELADAGYDNWVEEQGQ